MSEQTERLPEWVVKAAAEVDDQTFIDYLTPEQVRHIAVIIAYHAPTQPVNDRLVAAARKAVADFERDYPTLASNPHLACEWYREMTAALASAETQPRDEVLDALDGMVKRIWPYSCETNMADVEQARAILAKHGRGK